MTDIAAEYATELPNLPLDQGHIQSIRINALTKTAQELAKGDRAKGDTIKGKLPLRTRLLNGTSLQG